MKKTIANLAASLLFGSALLSAPARAALTEQIVDLQKPNGTVLHYLLSVDDAKPADIGVILFSGSQGRVHLEQGIPHPGANFLVRSRELFVQDGLAAAVYDPSGDIGAMRDADRMSGRHAEEVAQVLADFKRRSGVAKVYLVGTSRGTISAAYLANALKDQVDGVVLSSTLFSSSPAGPGLSAFDFGTISQPLLFVHHVADACRTTPPGSAQAMAGKYPVIWVEGGSLGGGGKEACGPYSAHGYLGREAETVRAIADWIRERKLVDRIGG
jgi:predicted alpha/beta-hydrolase family hydrolase